MLVIAVCLAIGCKHAAPEPPLEPAHLSADGVARYTISGQVVDANTELPIEGAWVTFTDIGKTFLGQDDASPPYRNEVVHVGRSDAMGQINATFEVGVCLKIAVEDHEAQALRSEADPSVLMDRILASAYESAEDICCVDISKAGYRTWARLYRSSDSQGFGNLGTIRLEKIPE